MSDLVLEHLKKIQAELAATKERDLELLSRLSSIETAIARLGRDGSATFEDIITDRHAVDKLKQRIERIERRLELN